MSQSRKIAIRGAGVVGLWQALTLARRGHKVTLCERSPVPFAHGCSLYAGAMLAPNCEKESAELVVRDLGRRGLALWRATYPGAIANGTLVVALAEVEPAFVDRFAGGLYYAEEGHLSPEPALHFLLEQAQAAGADVRLGEGEFPADADIVVDCRGLAARSDLPNLRGVRGERIVVKSREVNLSRPVRLLHPRFPLYVVPWGNGVHMIGATVIESEESGPITLRSALDLLSAAYALDPAFAEAEIVLQGAGARPALPDNRPRIIVNGRYIYVNGLYRHGFLLAPVMAELVAGFIETGATDPEVFVADSR
jgi:glycine oxidase